MCFDVLWQFRQCNTSIQRRDCLYSVQNSYIVKTLIMELTCHVVISAARSWSSKEDSWWSNSSGSCKGRRYWCGRLTERLIPWLYYIDVERLPCMTTRLISPKFPFTHLYLSWLIIGDAALLDAAKKGNLTRVRWRLQSIDFTKILVISSY